MSDEVIYAALRGYFLSETVVLGWGANTNTSQETRKYRIPDSTKPSSLDVLACWKMPMTQ